MNFLKSLNLLLISLLVLTPISYAIDSHLALLDLDGQLVVRQDPDGSKFYYHPDHLGSTDVITDQNKDIVELTTYKPYGQVVSGGEAANLISG